MTHVMPYKFSYVHANYACIGTSDNLTMSFTICCSQVVPDLGYGGMNRSSGLRGKSLSSSSRSCVMNVGKTIPFTTLCGISTSAMHALGLGFPRSHPTDGLGTRLHFCAYLTTQESNQLGLQSHVPIPARRSLHDAAVRRWNLVARSSCSGG